MNIRALVVMIYDMVSVSVAWILAYLLRFNLDAPPEYLGGAFATLFLVLFVHLTVFYFMGLYKGMWRYASIPDLQKIALALAVSIILIASIVFMFQFEYVPRSVLVMQPILLLVLMGGARMVYRIWKEWSLYGHLLEQGEPVLVIGAGDAGTMLVRELAKSTDWRVIGMLDDNEAKKGRSFNGVKILGKIDELEDVASSMEVTHVILALPSASASARRTATNIATSAGLSVLTVPAIEDLLSNKVTISTIRRVEIGDLLGRDAITLDDAGLHEFLDEKTVLVTGAGGSIGSELCRQIATYKPKNIILLDHSEYHLYMIDREMARKYPQLCIPVLGNVRDVQAMRNVFGHFHPDIVIHAAAYKHVPLLEDNISEGIRTNVIGTRTMADLSSEFKVDKFLLVSTDKAVNPANILGASKRAAEIYTQNKNAHTRAANITVRFGNVLDSAGSVIPLFRSQIENGGPVTVTHPDITRYFMTIPEAVSLILQAGAMGSGGEIFVLDMGEPVKIDDMARQMVTLSGSQPDEDIKIEYIGLRPGEKLYEELFYDQESLESTANSKIMLAGSRAYDWQSVLNKLDTMEQECLLDRVDEAVAVLQALVPEYLSSDNDPLDTSIAS